MFVRTPRLLLRPGWAEDAPALYRAICDEAVVRNLAQAPWPYLPAHAEAFLAREPDPCAPRLLIFARTAGAPRLIGGIGIRGDADAAPELGYWIARPFWGLGFATEAGEAVLRSARETLKLGPLVAGHYADNPASGRVLRKLGFRPTGQVERGFSAGRGCEVDSLLYSQSPAASDEPQLQCLEAA